MKISDNDILHAVGRVTYAPLSYITTSDYKSEVEFKFDNDLISSLDAHVSQPVCRREIICGFPRLPDWVPMTTQMKVDAICMFVDHYLRTTGNGIFAVDESECTWLSHWPIECARTRLVMERGAIAAMVYQSLPTEHQSGAALMYDNAVDSAILLLVSTFPTAKLFLVCTSDPIDMEKAYARQRRWESIIDKFFATAKNESLANTIKNHDSH